MVNWPVPKSCPKFSLYLLFFNQITINDVCCLTILSIKMNECLCLRTIEETFYIINGMKGNMCVRRKDRKFDLIIEKNEKSQ